MQRPRFVRSLDYPSLFISCDNTSRFGSESSRTYLLIFTSCRPPVGRDYVYVGVSPSLSVLFLEATPNIPVYLLSSFSHLSFFSASIAWRCAFRLQNPRFRQTLFFVIIFSEISFLTLQSIVFRFFRLSPRRGKESSLFVPSFLFFPFAVSLRHFADSFGSPLSVHRCVPHIFYESLKHFLFRFFFLYLYYSTKKRFVKCFLKNFLENFKNFFRRSFMGRKTRLKFLPFA